KSKWTIFKENLHDSDPKNRFLSHFWTSLHGRGSSSGLFRAMRDGTSTAQQAITFANQLAESSRVYAALHSGSSPLWSDHPAKTKKNIDTLRLLDAQQALPILLAAFDKFSPDEFKKLTQLLVVM